MSGSAVQKSKNSLHNYALLLKRVKETLLLGQQQIEAAKVQTYWQTGKHIHEHILHSKERADYGKRVISQLARDLEVGIDLLYRTLQFFQAFPIFARGRKSPAASLSWTQYRELMKIEEDGLRSSFLERAEKKGWTGAELRTRIRLELQGGGENGNGRDAGKKNSPPSGLKKLIPNLGLLYTYKLLEPENVHGAEEGLWLDLGFDNHHYIAKGLKGLKTGQIVESVKHTDGSYSVKATDRTEKDRYTYRALIERVVDGDTIIVKIHQGFDQRTRQYLRLRGIDAYEMPKSRRIVPGSRETGATAQNSGKRGREAKRFVEKLLEKAPEIILVSKWSDKYGRYLADVFIPQKGSVILREATIRTRNHKPRRDSTDAMSIGENLRQDNLLFLNQELLNQGLAVKAQ